MSKFRNSIIVLSCLLIFSFCNSKHLVQSNTLFDSIPEPPKGFEWVLNEDFSDEFTINPKEPFERPMYMHLITETYNWEDPPTEEELLNDSIHTTYYDYVRSYKLVKK